MLTKWLIKTGYLFKNLTEAKFRLIATSEIKNFTFLLLWLNKVFNAVDQKRLKLIGPNLCCAEWLLRNGAGVRFKGHPLLLTDYNELMILEESIESKKYLIEEIYAEDSGISRYGFDHLSGCHGVKKITLIGCNKIDTFCLNKLEYVKDSLEYLKIKACFNVKDKGLMELAQLRNLSTLILENLPFVEEKGRCEAELRKALAKCQITYSL